MFRERRMIFPNRLKRESWWCWCGLRWEWILVLVLLGVSLSCGSSKFRTKSGGSGVLNYSSVDVDPMSHPSDKFLGCHFNAGCYCKYDGRTEVYETVKRLWQGSGWNETHFLSSLSQFQKEMKSDPSRVYFISETDLSSLVQIVVGNSSSTFTRGPLYEFICLDVKLALIPTDYEAHGVLSHVSIVGSKLTILDGSAFAGLEIQNIQLSKNELFYISEYAFSSMSNSLTVLDLSANFLDEIPFTAFKTLKLLEWLNLSNNLIQGVSGEWFGVSRSLRQLTLSANSIQTLPQKLFSTFPRLIWLDLTSNFIRNLSQHSLPPNLQTLILMRNPISQFPSEVFHLRTLSWLVLAGCSIDRIPTSWPKGAPTLQMNQLDLTDNFIQIWPSRAFGSGLTVLDLDASKNYIGKVPSGAFHSMNTFRLSLGYNRIQTIDRDAFESLSPTLQYLNLDNNRLEHIPWNALTNLTSLVHLYVGSNLIQDDGVNPPQGGGGGGNRWDCRLTYMGLNGNQLTSIPLRLLSRCPNLLHLNLGYNQIPHLDQLAKMKKLKNLSTLVLRNNPIHTLTYFQSPGDVDHPHSPGNNKVMTDDDYDETEMSGLSTSSNPSLSNVFRAEVFPNLYELSLSFCQLSGELEPFPPLPLRNLEISMGLKSATTLSSEIFQSLTQLEWLALDHNSLQSIGEYCFYSNKNLSYVNLEWNRIGGSLTRQMFHPDIHQSISQVRLSHNKIQTIQAESFVSFGGSHLDLSYNAIQTIQRHAFLSSPSGNSHTSPFSSSSSSASSLGKSEGLHLYLSHNKLTTLKPTTFALHKFTLVDLSYNHISHFHFDTFGRKTLVGGLNISHNNLDRLVHSSTHFFTLEFLDVSHNKLHYKGLSGQMDSSCITDLLDLSHNHLERVDNSLFPKNCSLRELNLGSNHITSVDPESFVNLSDLTVLDLSNNQIGYVHEISFIKNHKLTSLDLSKNTIRTLPRDSLVGSHIEILNLSSNQFVNLPVGALSQIARRLKVLDMSRNSLEHLDSTMFEHLPGIVALNLSQNRLNILPDNAFANLGSLRELDLSGNLLTANFKEVFHFVPKLKVLRLSGCGLRVLPALPLAHLVSLDVSRNKMEEMKMQSLSSLARLRSLDLSHNELTGTPNWTPLRSLTSLRVSSNPIKSLTKDTFFGLSRLETLEMVDMAKVDRFDSDVLSGLRNLRSLAVETYPNIEKYRFRLGAVLSGIGSLEELRVRIREPVLSDQLLGGISPKLRKLVIEGETLTRIEPLAFDGLQNCLRMDLTISHTAVDEIPSKIFQLLLNAQWARLDLSHNQLSSFDSTALYPNRTTWYTKGTKLLQGGLSLEGNEWVCECNLVWMGEWLRRWLRESFESHSSSIPSVHSTYESIRRPTCTHPKGYSIPLIDLYPDILCHASALSSAPTPSLPFNSFFGVGSSSLWFLYSFVVLIVTSTFQSLLL